MISLDGLPRFFADRRLCRAPIFSEDSPDRLESEEEGLYAAEFGSKTLTLDVGGSGLRMLLGLVDALNMPPGASRGKVVDVLVSLPALLLAFARHSLVIKKLFSTFAVE